MCLTSSTRSDTLNCRALAYFSLVVAVLGTFLQNYATGVIAGVLCFACKEFDLSSIQSGWLAGMIFFGALFGSLLAGPIADRFGRKKTLLVSALFYVVSNAPFLWISSYSLSLLLRFTSGIAVGITSLIVPLYLAEIAPPSRRGAFVATSSMCAALGILIAYLINWLYADAKDWRSMLFITAIPAVFQAIIIRFISESPSWLFRQGKIKEGMAAIQCLHSETKTPPQGGEAMTSSWKDIFHPRFRKGLWIGIALIILQQASGINAVISFTHFIFKKTGINQEMSTMFLTFLLGVINLFAATCALFLIDRLGRRKLLLFSQIGIVLSLSLVTLQSFFEAFPYLSVGATIFFYGYLFTWAWTDSLGFNLRNLPCLDSRFNDWFHDIFKLAEQFCRRGFIPLLPIFFRGYLDIFQFFDFVNCRFFYLLAHHPRDERQELRRDRALALFVRRRNRIKNLLITRSQA